MPAGIFAVGHIRAGGVRSCLGSRTVLGWGVPAFEVAMANDVFAGNTDEEVRRAGASSVAMTVFSRKTKVVSKRAHDKRAAVPNRWRGDFFFSWFFVCLA